MFLLLLIDLNAVSEWSVHVCIVYCRVWQRQPDLPVQRTTW